MDNVTWSDEYSVGNRLLDQQHRQLMETLNRLIDQPQATVDSELVGDALSELTRFAVEHFREEQRAMEVCGYPDIEEHKRQHEEFRQKIVQCCMATTLHIEAVPRDLLLYLRDWMQHHVLNEDMKYKSYLAEQGN
jgi:hemerythrin